MLIVKIPDDWPRINNTRKKYANIIVTIYLDVNMLVLSERVSKCWGLHASRFFSPQIRRKYFNVSRNEAKKLLRSVHSSARGRFQLGGKPDAQQLQYMRVLRPEGAAFWISAYAATSAARVIPSQRVNYSPRIRLSNTAATRAALLFELLSG